MKKSYLDNVKPQTSLMEYFQLQFKHICEIEILDQLAHILLMSSQLEDFGFLNSKLV